MSNSKKEIVVKSLSCYIKWLENNKKSIYKEKDERIYFRGESKDYGKTKCVPSLLRHSESEKDIFGRDNKEISDSYLNEKEFKNYNRILRRKPEEFAGLSNLDILAKMQHYNSGTRLLDITTNPLIALFFALQDCLEPHKKSMDEWKSKCNKCKDANRVSEKYCDGCLSAKESFDREDAYVYIFHAKQDNILSYDSDRALFIATLPKMEYKYQQLILKYIKKYPYTLITPELLNPRKKACKKLDEDTRHALGKFIYECERERDALNQNHHTNPKDLEGIFYVKPRFENERLESQDGLFILFGLGKRNIDDEPIAIKIPKESKLKMMAELYFFAGITNGKILQDLESITEDKKDELYKELMKSKHNLQKQ